MYMYITSHVAMYMYITSHVAMYSGGNKKIYWHEVAKLMNKAISIDVRKFQPLKFTTRKIYFVLTY